MARWNSCIVLDPGPGTRNLWQFNSTSKKFPLQKEEQRAHDQPLPQSMFAKDWGTFLQPKLNIAWLPPEHLFLRAIQLPKSSIEELQAMIDIQLEKLSPLPPAQIVWSFEVLPQIVDDMQTVIVIMVARHHVETFLGELEKHGYLADRLELPILDQLAATEIYEDGIWVYPVLGSSRSSCLFAWIYDGVLRNLSLIPVPSETDLTHTVQEHVTQVAWAGEIEGWLTSEVKVHLVASPDVAATWENYFTEEQGVVVVPPVPLTDLASRTGRRAIAEQDRLNLLPPEFASRYRQALVDKVWMRALAALVVLYILGAAVYIGWAQSVHWQKNSIDAEIAALSLQYTNALKLKAEVAILKDQLALQYAALDCWKAISDNIPSELKLDKIDFSKGKVTITGSGSEKISEFETRLRRAVDFNDQLVFAEVEVQNIVTRANGVTAWTIKTSTTRGADQ